MRGLRRIGWGVAGLALIGLLACRDQVLPTAPEGDEVELEEPEPLPAATSGASIFIDQAHPLSPRSHELLSDEAELEAGRYRYAVSGGAATAIARDEFIITEVAPGDARVRRVLESRIENGELVVETGPGYWHEVVQGGRYEIGIPLGAGESVATLPQAPATGPSPVVATLTSEGLPPLEYDFGGQDICGWIETTLEAIPGNQERYQCGEEQELEIGPVKIGGTLDTLRIDTGLIRVTGDMNIVLDVDVGGISGGSPPIFSPCNERAYLGCIATPSGAKLIEFLRLFAPQIPETSLPAVRLCIPGQLIRKRAASWSFSEGYTPPVWVVCSIVPNSWVLPTIVLPSVRAVESELAADISGELLVRLQADGFFQLQLPVPYLGVGKTVRFSDYFTVGAKAGVFFLLRGTVKNWGGTARLALAGSGSTTNDWNPSTGWNGEFAPRGGDFTMELLDMENPEDSVIVRVGMPVELSAEICLGITACAPDGEGGSLAAAGAGPSAVDAPAAEHDGPPGLEWWDPQTSVFAGTDLYARPLVEGVGLGEGYGDSGSGAHSVYAEDDPIGKWILDQLKLGATVKAGVSMFYDITKTRDQVHPTDPQIDNLHISMDQGYSLTLAAKLEIPNNFLVPDGELGDDKTWECCRIPVTDYWGQGHLEVTTVTTGSAPDPNGYFVTVERADSFPKILDAGTQRIGAWKSTPRGMEIGPNGTVTFGPAIPFPCIGVYTDALLTSNPLWGLTVAGARASGLDIPTWGVTSPCPWLIAAYDVTLGGVSDNCTVVGGAKREDVWFRQVDLFGQQSGVVPLTFEVECGTPGASGDLEVILPPRTIVEESPPVLTLDGVYQGSFAESDTIVLTGLAEGGPRIVAVAGLDDLCTSAPEEATVVASETVTVQLTLACEVPPAPVGAVQYRATFEGAGLDENGYVLVRDGEQVGALHPEGFAQAENITAGTPVVLSVIDIAPNCQPLETNPRLFVLGEGQAQVVDFPVRCVDAVPDTLVGSVEAQGWPVPTVTMRSEEGVTRTLRGPKVEELIRLSGTRVRIWGESGPTDFNVHGYGLRSILGDDRWLGILLDRGPDGVWLMGEEAIRIVDPPPALAAMSENLVWIAGVEEDGGIRPTLFGVIRGGGS